MNYKRVNLSLFFIVFGLSLVVLKETGLADSPNFLRNILIFGTLWFGVFLWWLNLDAMEWLRQRGKLRPEKSRPTELKYSEQEFQEMVSKALDEVPKKFDKEWNNVAVIVSTEWPTEEDMQSMGVAKGHVVCGTYIGHDRTEGAGGSTNVIVVYQPALELLFGSDKERLQQGIRKTVLHELAHHLGMSHERMKACGLY